MKKKAKAGRKRSAPKDLSARKASAVKGGLQPAVDTTTESRKVQWDWIKVPR